MAIYLSVSDLKQASLILAAGHSKSLTSAEESRHSWAGSQQIPHICRGEHVTPWSVSPVFVIVSTHLQVSPLFLISPWVLIPVFPAYLLPVRLVYQVNQRVFRSPPFSFALFCESSRLWPLPVWTLNPPAWSFCLPWPQACLPLSSSWTLTLLWSFACLRPFSCLLLGS
jgi:hypothetical protein